MVTNYVYTVAGAKGGVGKTTTSINLGASLAAAGRSVVVVELDLAMANLVDFLELGVDTSAATTLHDVLSGGADVEEAVYETATGLSVVPSGTELADYAGTDLGRLPEVVETLRWHHDVVILDTPAGVSDETIRPMQLSDEVVLVSTPRVASIRNAENTLELAGKAEADVRGLVLTKSGTGSSPGAENIAEFLGVELLGHVPEDDAVPHSQDEGKPVTVKAPTSGAAVAYRKVARKLVANPSAGPDARTDDTAGSEPRNRDRSRDDDPAASHTEHAPSEPPSADSQTPDRDTASDGPTARDASASAGARTDELRDDDTDGRSLATQIRSFIGL